MINFDDPAFSDLQDRRVLLLIELLARTIYGDEVPVALESAGLNPGDFRLTTARLAWTGAVPEAAQQGKLGVLVRVVSQRKPAFEGELERRMSQLLQAGTGGSWYSYDDPYKCSFVGLRGARAVIDRGGLRSGLRELAEDEYWVLIVHGQPRSGKSHTWQLIDHLRNAGKLAGLNKFARVTTHSWTGEVTGAELAESLASRLGLSINLTQSGELDDARVRKFLDQLAWVYPGGDGITRWIVLDGLDRPGVQEGARDLARGLIQMVEDRELMQTRLIVTGLDPLGLHVGYTVRTEEIPAIDRSLLHAFLTDVAKHLGQKTSDGELQEWIVEILGQDRQPRDLSEVEASVVNLVTTRWVEGVAQGG